MTKSTRWRRSDWKGLANLECLQCAFATLDRGRMLDHQRQHKGQPAPEPEAASPEEES